MNKRKIIIGALFIIQSSLFAQIANKYLGDKLIENDANVLFSEMFEETTLQGMKANWTDTSNVYGLITFDSSVPANSLGSKSCKITTINDAILTNSANTETTYLFKRLPTTIQDSVFVRFYIKYNNKTSFHHSGVWMGGNNPSNAWPGVKAGYKPAGDTAFHVGAEVRGTTMQAKNNASFGFYNYFMNMHASTQINPKTGSPYYWGNDFNNSNPNAVIDMTAWNCVEVMVKLNNPVSDSTGEAAMWINGNKVYHYGYHFTNGSWGSNGSSFTEGAGSPFEGFRWRSSTVLGFNYVWLTSFVTNNPNGHVSDVYYDHLVVAKKYIGPIANGITSINDVKNEEDVSVYPNPTSGLLQFNKEVKNLKIFDAHGKLLLCEKTPQSKVDVSSLTAGLYVAQVEEKYIKFIIR